MELHVGEDHHAECLVYLPQVNLVRLNASERTWVVMYQDPATFSLAELAIPFSKLSLQVSAAESGDS